MSNFQLSREGYGELSEDHARSLAEYEVQHGCLPDEVEERSAGCIVFTHHPSSQDLMVLLIKNNKNAFGFPKGHMEEDEDDLSAAIRETAEETGVVLPHNSLLETTKFEVKTKLFSKLHKSAWVKHPQYPDERVRPNLIKYKTITYFPAYVDKLQCQPQLEEIQAVEYVVVTDAVQLLSSKLQHILGTLLESSVFHEWMATVRQNADGSL